MTSLFSFKRVAATAFAAAAFMSIGVAARATPDDPQRFRAIQVDVSGVRDTRDSVSADLVARELPADLHKSFAAYLAPNDSRAPILVAKVRLVTLGAEGGGGGLNSTQAVDYIEGEGVVVGAGGRQIASFPITSAVHAYPGEDTPGGVSGYRRIANLAASFAEYLPGKMGL
jgi:hypothetical protein